MPLSIKIAYTAFLCILVPVYWRAYGPTNFLWFSDIALILTCIALWREDSLLVSMMAVGVLPLELPWILDFLSGGQLIGLTAYMFDDGKPLFLRALSLFHIALPPTLIWMLYRLGFDRRALWAQTALAWTVLLLTYAITDPSENINWVFGPGPEPQTAIPGWLYLIILMLVLPACVYLPSYLLLRRLF